MSATERLSGYAELADVLANLPLLVREARRARGLSLRAAGAESGVHFTTLGRLERGEPVRLTAAIMAVRWLDQRKAAS